MLYPIFIFLCCPFLSSALETERDQKSFSLFSVLKWENTACQAVSDDALTGVCVTSQECDDMGGDKDGNCAAGFGACCVLTLSGTATAPGGTVTQNCTYIQNVDYPSAEVNTRTYSYMVTKCSSEICQVRLDFQVLNLAQPVAATGDCAGDDRDRILLDAGGNDPDRTLCGDLTGQHVYMDVSPANTNAATITITADADAAAGGTKNWRIKVSQIECDSEYRAPDGCFQYFFENVNTIMTFNYDGAIARANTDGGVLANLDYRICIKKNAGMCSIEYTPSEVQNGMEAFDLGAVAAATAANAATAQHGVGGDKASCATIIAADGTQTAGTNYIQIPGAVNVNEWTGDSFCGGKLSNFALDPTQGPDVLGANVHSTVIATGTPFEIRYVAFGDQAMDAGFSIMATQRPCGILPHGVTQSHPQA